MTATGWLEGRLREVPPSLKQRLEDALRVHRSPAGLPVEQQLRRAADGLLEEAKTGGAGRDTALTLLAADALVTFACEMTAETAPERLGDLR